MTAVVGLGLSLLGVTGIDAGMINGVVNGFVAIITFGAALWSWYSHRNKNAVIAGRTQ